MRTERKVNATKRRCLNTGDCDSLTECGKRNHVRWGSEVTEINYKFYSQNTAEPEHRLVGLYSILPSIDKQDITPSTQATLKEEPTTRLFRILIWLWDNLPFWKKRSKQIQVQSIIFFGCWTYLLSQIASHQQSGNNEIVSEYFHKYPWSMI